MGFLSSLGFDRPKGGGRDTFNTRPTSKKKDGSSVTKFVIVGVAIFVVLLLISSIVAASRKSSGSGAAVVYQGGPGSRSTSTTVTASGANSNAFKSGAFPSRGALVAPHVRAMSLSGIPVMTAEEAGSGKKGGVLS